MRVFPALRPELVALLVVSLASPALAEGNPPSPAANAPPRAPTAERRTQGIGYAVDGDRFVLTDSRAQKTFRLHPIAAAVYALADGQKPLSAIRAEAEAASGMTTDEETLFAALDALADAGLLVARVTPPGSVELGSFVAVDGTTGAGLVAATTEKGRAVAGLAEARESEQKEKSALRVDRARESKMKSEDVAVQRSHEARKKAMNAQTQARADEQRNKEANQKVSRPLEKKLTDELASAGVRAESAVKSESSLRMRNEQTAKANVRGATDEQSAKARVRVTDEQSAKARQSPAERLREKASEESQNQAKPR